MSSHREAPETSKDPVVDNTDTYAFVSPDRPDTVTIITNYIPAELPAGGPNFFEFGDDVLYEIKIDNDGDARPNVVYEFRFKTVVQNPNTFLYNTGPITSLDDPDFNRRQYYTVSRRVARRGRLGRSEVIASDLPSPPCNVGFRSTPDYPALADSAIFDIGDGIKVFAGQRLDGFFVDLGSIFDLGALRPFQQFHLISSPNGDGVNALRFFSVHTIALQIPIRLLTRDGSAPTDPLAANSTIGVYGSASRPRGTFRDRTRSWTVGPFTQVSRLGNPLFNEVIVPMGRKDEWNRVDPTDDDDFAQYVARPELGRLLPVLYPDVFPNLATLQNTDRADLLAILLTGIPAGLIPGFQNYTGPTQADLLRLNVAIPPSASPSIYGLLGNDLAGFPNGRRVFDDIVAIELRAVAGATYPLVAPSYTPDAAAGALLDGTEALPFLERFPYLNHPESGYDILPLDTLTPP